MKKFIPLLLSFMIVVALFSGCTTSSTPPNKDELYNDSYSFIMELSSGKYSEAKKNHKYDIVMALLTGRKTLQTVWESLTLQHGAFVDIYGYEYEEVTGYDSIIIKCAFENLCVDFKITYKHDTFRISGLHSAPNADKSTLAGAATNQMPSGIIERAFTFGTSGLELPAILTLPYTGNNFPVVILVHGSGPNNSDESIGNQAPFRDIAWALAKQGIAVLRYDKRTLVYPESFDDTSTLQQETIQDAMLAAITVQSIPEIDASRIFILGHSLGGTAIPLIAEVTPEARGFIMMGAALTPLQDLMITQMEYVYNIDGKLTIRERLSLWNSKRMQTNINELTADSDIAPAKLFGISSAYWLYLNEYDFLGKAALIEKPLLILQGESDYQVPLSDFEAIKNALAGKDNVLAISYTGLGHLMTEAGSPPSPDDYYKALYVDSRVINDIAAFVKDN